VEVNGLSLPRKLVTDHLDADLLTHLEPKVTDEVLVDPRLQFAHPEKCVSHYFTFLFLCGVFIGLGRDSTEDVTSCRRHPRPCSNVPESGLGLTALRGTGTSGGFSGGGALERGGGGIGLSSHGGVGRWGSTGGSSCGISSSVLVLERIEILERHIRLEKM
jgi:hypothetical protein